ncbi:MAG: amino acid permease, partial [Acidobacteria bacterium]|nr:amino acid permease [Acidobacteriota bacterium]
MTAADPPARASRIGFWMATALVVGNMIGSGIFLLPAALAPFGADNLPGWLLTAGGAVTLALVFAHLSRVVPGAGGPYAYTREAFGDLAGFTVGWAYWVSVWVGNAAIATGAVGYLGSFVPWMVASPLNTALATLGFVWAFTFVNCAGIRAAGWVQGITTVLKLLPLVAAIALLVSRLDTVDWHGAGTATFTLGGTVSVVTLTLWAMLGLESATIPADKVEGASRTVFRATMWGTVLTIVI